MIPILPVHVIGERGGGRAWMRLMKCIVMEFWDTGSGWSFSKRLFPYDKNTP